MKIDELKQRATLSELVLICQVESLVRAELAELIERNKVKEAENKKDAAFNVRIVEVLQRCVRDDLAFHERQRFVFDMERMREKFNEEYTP